MRRRAVITMGGVFLTSGCLRLTEEGSGGSGQSAGDRTNAERAMTTADRTETQRARTTTDRTSTRREETTAGGESETGGNSETSDDSDSDSKSESESETGGSVTVTGRLVDSSGAAVTSGELLSLGDTEGLTSVAPDGDGAFALDLTDGNRYLLQYTQGADGYPSDGLPDLYTVGRISTDGDADLGALELPTAYDVSITVETASGDDVTDDASVMVHHENDGAMSGFELLHDPAELVGSVSFRAEYAGASSSRAVTVADSRDVTLTLG